MNLHILDRRIIDISPCIVKATVVERGQNFADRIVKGPFNCSGPFEHRPRNIFAGSEVIDPGDLCSDFDRQMIDPKRPTFI